jgi:3-methyladenine DNA glycosylase AlkD
MQKSVQKLIKKLQCELDNRADEKTREWFTNYLKGVVEYRGVKTPQISGAVKQWVDHNGILELPLNEKLEIAFALLAERVAEEKFACAIFIQKYLIKHAPAMELLSRTQSAFESGHIWDWSTNDWYSVRVLGPLVAAGDKQVLKKIAGWKSGKSLWQRRSSIIPFRATAKIDRDHDLISSVVEKLVHDSERFVQTGVGWLIADKSRHFPDFAAQLIEQHFDFLSTEVIDRHTKYLPKHRQYKALKRGSAS